MGVARGLRIGFPEDWWWMSRPLGGPVALPHRRTEVGGRKTEIFAMEKGKRRISQWSAKKCVRSDAKLERESTKLLLFLLTLKGSSKQGTSELTSHFESYGGKLYFEQFSKRFFANAKSNS